MLSFLVFKSWVLEDQPWDQYLAWERLTTGAISAASGFLKITISNHPYPKEDYSSHDSRFCSLRVTLWSDRPLLPARKLQAEYIDCSVLLVFYFPFVIECNHHYY